MINRGIVFLRSNPVDPDSRVEKEVYSLINAGYDVKVVGWDRNANYKVKESLLKLWDKEVRIYRFGIKASFGGGVKSNLWPLIKFQICLFIWLLKNRKSYDVIHACDFDTAYTASHCARLFKKRLVYDIFDYYIDSFSVPQKLKKIIKKIDDKVINYADNVIICTEQRIKQISSTKPKKLSIIHNTPPVLNLTSDKPEIKNSKFKIVYVGILDKGRFLKEIADVVVKNPNYEFHLGGFGPLEDYFSKLAFENNNIFFYGKLPYKRTLELESNCDIMVAIYDPSIHNHYYAAPNKFYEALMLGKPIIMAQNTGMSDVISENNFGEIIEFDVKSLEVAIDKLIKRRAEWPQISHKMKQLYEKDYSWKEMEIRLRNLYRNISRNI